MVSRAILPILIVLGIPGVAMALGTSQARDLNLPYCGRDLNGDGSEATDKGEVEECAQYADGNLCPWDRVDCEERTNSAGQKRQTCPKGENHECVKTGNNKYECSPWPCAKPVQTLGNIAAYDKDGTVSGDRCNKNFLIMNGHIRECREPGFDSNYVNCCRADAPGHDPVPGSEWERSCSHTEWHTDKARCDNLLHAVGRYCSTWLYVQERLCISRRTVYCRFFSPIATIVHEQGRPQLKSFYEENRQIWGPIADEMPGVWGSGKNPICRGFYPSEFQMLDVARMDLSGGAGFLVAMMEPADPQSTKKGPCASDPSEYEQEMQNSVELVQKKTEDAAEAGAVTKEKRDDGAAGYTAGSGGSTAGNCTRTAVTEGELDCGGGQQASRMTYACPSSAKCAERTRKWTSEGNKVISSCSQSGNDWVITVDFCR